MTLRRWLRRILPVEMRLLIALARRRARDRRARTRFTTVRGQAPLAHSFAEYQLAIRDYPGQEALAEGKRVNQRVMARALDGALIAPGEVLSLGRFAGRPSRQRGYLEAAATVEGRLISDIGGATCLLATVVYNSALSTGARVAVERYLGSKFAVAVA